MQKLPRYRNVESIIDTGYRRATKSELRRLGRSEKSVLYTSANTKRATRFFTRNDLYKTNIDRQIAESGQRDLERVRVRKHEFVIYANPDKPLSISGAEKEMRKFFNFLQRRYKMKREYQFGYTYTLADGRTISVSPIIWQNRQSSFERFKDIILEYVFVKKNKPKVLPPQMYVSLIEGHIWIPY